MASLSKRVSVYRNFIDGTFGGVKPNPGVDHSEAYVYPLYKVEDGFKVKLRKIYGYSGGVDAGGLVWCLHGYPYFNVSYVHNTGDVSNFFEQELHGLENGTTDQDLTVCVWLKGDDPTLEVPNKEIWFGLDFDLVEMTTEEKAAQKARRAKEAAEAEETE